MIKKIKQLKLMQMHVFSVKIKFERWVGYLERPEVFAISIGVVSCAVFCWTSGKLVPFILPDEPSFFFTSAGFVGGALAIIVTLNTLILQNSVDKLPARIYKLAVNDARLNSIYAFLAFIAIVQFCMGIALLQEDGTPRGQFLRAGLVGDVWAFVLIFLYWRLVVTRLDPYGQMQLIAGAIREKMDRFEMHVASYMKAIAPSDQEALLTEVHIRRQLTPLTTDISNDLQDLAGLFNRYMAHSDRALAIQCLNTIIDSVIYLYSKRRASAIAIPTEYIFTSQSDLSDFSLKIDEILLPLWKDAVTNQNEDVIRTMTMGYRNMISVALSVSHKNSPFDNPLAAYAFNGYKNLVEIAMSKKYGNGLFYSADSLLDIIKSIYQSETDNHHSPEHFREAYRLLNRLYFDAITRKDEICQKVMLEASINVFGHVALYDKSNRRLDEVAIEQFGQTIEYANLPFPKSAMRASDGVAQIEGIIQRAIGAIPKEPKKTDIIKFIRSAKLFLGAFTKSFGKFPTTLTLNLDRFYGAVGEITLDMLVNHTAKTGGKERAALQEIIDSIIGIHERAVRNYKYKERGHSRYEEYSDKLVIIGIQAAAHNYDVSAKKIIDSLIDASEWLLENKNSEEYSANSLAHHAGYIAMTAHWRRRYDISRHYKQRLHVFEDSWVRKLHPNGFKADVNYTPSPYSVRGGFERSEYGFGFGAGDLEGYLETPQDRLAKEVSHDQFYKFGEYLWRDKSRPAPNPPQHTTSELS